MKVMFLISLLTLIPHLSATSQAVYVDSATGDDKNSGTKESPVYSVNKAAEIIRSRDNDFTTIKLNPGVYVFEKHVQLTTEKQNTDKRIVIEASILPGDESWTPEKMPVIANKSMKGEIPDSYNFVVSFLIGTNHVTIRGIKFHGYFYPNARYFPVARFDKTKTDLLVEQCVFAGESEASQIHAGIIAHGDDVKIDHCIFYKVRNTVVFFQDSGNENKKGNAITSSIIYDSNQAVWNVLPDKDFIFRNNIVSNCRYVWVKYNNDPTKYSINNCILVNNKYYKGAPDSQRLNPAEFELTENNVITKGEISLRLIDNDDNPLLLGVDNPLPIDYMHAIPGTLGSDIGAGLFKVKK